MKFKKKRVNDFDKTLFREDAYSEFKGMGGR